MMNNTPEHKRAHAFLKKHQMGVLSTASEAGTVWGASVYFLTDDNLNIYFVTRSETFKYKNIEAQPFAALTVTDSEAQITVQLSGKITTMPVKKYMDVFFDKFAAMRPEGDYHWAPPVDKVHKGSYMPLQLTPSHLQYANYGKRRIEVYGDYIERIIPKPR